MTKPTELLPLKNIVAPATPGEVEATLRDCFATSTPAYLLGGETSLDFGLPAKTPGIGLSMAKLDRVLDYPARDMTITVEAGLTMQALADTLAAENQQLPIDVPNPAKATIGGVIATNFNGPRRYGAGTIRDYVIGISAVDGRGEPFKGGGRVVKNVAGYDFCKLLTGSLGTLGAITQVTLRLKPRPESTALVACPIPDLAEAERLLSAIITSETTPVAVELIGGPEWGDPLSVNADGTFAGSGARMQNCAGLLVVGLEGTTVEVRWMVDRLKREWRELGVIVSREWLETDAAEVWRRLSEFPSHRPSPLVVKAGVRPSGVTAMIEAMKAVDANISFQAHAGNGVVIGRLASFPTTGLSRTLVGRLQAVAAAHDGHIVVLSNPGGAEMTHQSVWGGPGASFELMTAVKRQFDPRDVLNPGRFVYV